MHFFCFLQVQPIKKLFFQGSKSGDYHDFQNFITWVNNQLMLNIPATSVLVIDNN
jgi:hypothetical protein